jgi:hypothetical protein
VKHGPYKKKATAQEEGHCELGWLRRAEASDDEQPQDTREAHELGSRTQRTPVRHVENGVGNAGKHPNDCQDVDSTLIRVDKLRDDDSGGEAGQHLERVEMRVPSALGDTINAIREIPWVAVVSQSPSVRASASVPCHAEAKVRQEDSDENAPKADCHNHSIK